MDDNSFCLRDVVFTRGDAEVLLRLRDEGDSLSIRVESNGEPTFLASMIKRTNLHKVRDEFSEFGLIGMISVQQGVWKMPIGEYRSRKFGEKAAMTAGIEIGFHTLYIKVRKLAKEGVKLCVYYTEASEETLLFSANVHGYLILGGFVSTIIERWTEMFGLK